MSIDASPLLVRPKRASGCVHELTPDLARRRRACGDWNYVGFAAYRLSEGQSAQEQSSDQTEAILVFIEGRGEVSIGGQSFGEQGDRLNVFEKTKPVALYIPAGARWSVQATTDCEIAICRAPLPSDTGPAYPAQVIGDIGQEIRGQGSNERLIHPIAMEDKDVAHSLLVTEVFTPAGNWSSYPPHRHDEDDYPHMTYLEETYYHRVSPGQGFGIQRVFTEDSTLDETMSVADRDLVLVPKGHHPCAAPHGYELYYLNVMAGPLRKWRFKNHPDHEWIVKS